MDSDVSYGARRRAYFTNMHRHEGNYSMVGIMAGWRRQEVEAEFNSSED